jgi:hypothetical protein
MPRRAIRDRPTGRPTVLTPDTRSRFLEAVRAGAPYNLACAHAGFSYSSFARWMQHGSDATDAAEEGRPYPAQHEPYREFWEEAQRARAAGAMTDLLLVQKAARGGYVIQENERRYRDPVSGELVTETEKKLAPVDWRAAAFVLERTHREHFPKPTVVEVTGAGGGPVEVSGVQVEELAVRLLANIAAVRAELPAGDVQDAEVLDEVAG